jgi:hypothetical protein
MALQAWKDSIDTIWAHGAIEITNTGDVPIQIGDISISFVGDDNSILGTAIHDIAYTGNYYCQVKLHMQATQPQ